MIRFVPLTPALLAAVETAEPPVLGDVAALCLPGLASAALDGGIVLGAAGVAPLWPGRALCWTRLGSAIERGHWFQIMRFIVRRLDRLQRDPAFRRLEATVRSDFPRGCCFIERVGGFRKEGLMTAFAPDGADHWLYSRVAVPPAHLAARQPEMRGEHAHG